MSYLPRFRIFEKGKRKHIYEFQTDNYDTAYQLFLDHIKKIPNNENKKYYFKMVSEYYDANGKRHERFIKSKYKYTDECRQYDIVKIKSFLDSDNPNCVSNGLNAVGKVNETISEYSILCIKIKSMVSPTDLATAPESKIDEIIKLINQADELKGKIENYTSMIEHNHTSYEWWNLNSHILEDLKYSLPILIKDSQGYPQIFTEKAKGTEFESKPWLMWKKELENLLLHVNLYLYYSEYGIIDKNDKQMVKIHKKYKNTIPRHKASTDIDYLELNKLTQEHWNAIWDWMKEWGQGLWD